jgi:hypothetical protein
MPPSQRKQRDGVKKTTAAPAIVKKTAAKKSAPTTPSLFYPFRALGYITEGAPFAVQRRGTESFVTVSAGKAFQIYNCDKLRLVMVGLLGLWQLLLVVFFHAAAALPPLPLLLHDGRDTTSRNNVMIKRVKRANPTSRSARSSPTTSPR